MACFAYAYLTSPKSHSFTVPSELMSRLWVLRSLHDQTAMCQTPISWSSSSWWQAHSVGTHRWMMAGLRVCR